MAPLSFLVQGVTNQSVATGHLQNVFLVSVPSMNTTTLLEFRGVTCTFLMTSDMDNFLQSQTNLQANGYALFLSNYLLPYFNGLVNVWKINMLKICLPYTLTSTSLTYLALIIQAFLTANGYSPYLPSSTCVIVLSLASNTQCESGNLEARLADTDLPPLLSLTLTTSTLSPSTINPVLFFQNIFTSLYTSFLTIGKLEYMNCIHPEWYTFGPTNCLSTPTNTTNIVLIMNMLGEMVTSFQKFQIASFPKTTWVLNTNHFLPLLFPSSISSASDITTIHTKMKELASSTLTNFQTMVSSTSSSSSSLSSLSCIAWSIPLLPQSNLTDVNVIDSYLGIFSDYSIATNLLVMDNVLVSYSSLAFSDTTMTSLPKSFGYIHIYYNNSTTSSSTTTVAPTSFLLSKSYPIVTDYSSMSSLSTMFSTSPPLSYFKPSSTSTYATDIWKYYVAIATSSSSITTTTSSSGNSSPSVSSSSSSSSSSTIGTSSSNNSNNTSNTSNNTNSTTVVSAQNPSQPSSSSSFTTISSPLPESINQINSPTFFASSFPTDQTPTIVSPTETVNDVIPSDGTYVSIVTNGPTIPSSLLYVDSPTTIQNIQYITSGTLGWSFFGIPLLVILPLGLISYFLFGKGKVGYELSMTWHSKLSNTIPYMRWIFDALWILIFTPLGLFFLYGIIMVSVYGSKPYPWVKAWSWWIFLFAVGVFAGGVIGNQSMFTDESRTFTFWYNLCFPLWKEQPPGFYFLMWVWLLMYGVIGIQCMNEQKKKVEENVNENVDVTNALDSWKGVWIAVTVVGALGITYYVLPITIQYIKLSIQNSVRKSKQKTQQQGIQMRDMKNFTKTTTSSPFLPIGSVQKEGKGGGKRGRSTTTAETEMVRKDATSNFFNGVADLMDWILFSFKLS